MGGVCFCSPWTCRPVWPVVIILAAVPCMMLCSDSPAAGAGKVYPRGNHWAVGHLMGKKSAESLPEPQQTNSDYLTPSAAAGVTEPDRYQRLMGALLRQKNQRQKTAESGWREEDRDKYLRELSDLLLLAVKLQDKGST